MTSLTDLIVKRAINVRSQQVPLTIKVISPIIEVTLILRVSEFIQFSNICLEDWKHLIERVKNYYYE